MADGNKQTNQPVKKFKVKFVGGGRYDLASLPKTKSGTRRSSFRRSTVPQQLIEGIEGTLSNYSNFMNVVLNL